MQRQDSDNASGGTTNGEGSTLNQLQGPSSRFPSQSFVNDIVDAAARDAADEKRRQPQNTERVYQACLPCKKRKTKCVRGDETSPDVLPCARCRRQGKVADCVLAPRGPWPVGDSRRPREYRALHRSGSSQAEGRSVMSPSDHSPRAEVVDVGAWEDYVRPQRPNVPAFTTSTSGSAALDQLMSNVQDLRHAAPEREYEDSTFDALPEGLRATVRGPHEEYFAEHESRRTLSASFDKSTSNPNGDPAKYVFNPDDPQALLELSAAERNMIPLHEARKLGPFGGLYTWDLRDWDDDKAMVKREMAKRPYASAREARDFRNDTGLRPSDSDALNKACYEIDRRDELSQALVRSSVRQTSSPGQGQISAKRGRRASTAVQQLWQRSEEYPNHKPPPTAGSRPSSAAAASRHAPPDDPRSDKLPAQEYAADDEETEVRLRLRILAVEKEELELQLKLHRLQGTKRRRID